MLEKKGMYKSLAYISLFYYYFFYTSISFESYLAYTAWSILTIHVPYQKLQVIVLLCILKLESKNVAQEGHRTQNNTFYVTF